MIIILIIKTRKIGYATKAMPGICCDILTRMKYVTADPNYIEMKSITTLYGDVINTGPITSYRSQGRVFSLLLKRRRLYDNN